MREEARAREEASAIEKSRIEARRKALIQDRVTALTQTIKRMRSKNSLYSPYLDLSHTTLNDEDIEILAKELETNDNLLSLDLSHNAITDKGVYFLIKALRKNKKLRSLIITDNPISISGEKCYYWCF